MPDPEFKKVLCCLDLSSVDEKVLSFTSELKKAGILGHIKLLHVIDNDLEEKARQYSDNSVWLDYKSEIRDGIAEKAAKYFDNSSDLEIIVRAGSPLEVINTKSKSEAADLVVVGNKLRKNGLGIAAHHIARSSLCDVLFVPEGDFGIPSSSLIAYDFSEHAEKTMEIGYSVSKKLGIQYLKALNVLASPVGYFKSGRLHNEFVESEKKTISKKWIKEIELHPEYKDVHFDIVENEKNDVAHYILSASDQMENPIVFLGSKGKTASSAFLLGSVTEKLMMKDEIVPVWIHKMKGENFDLFDAVFKGD